MSWTGNTRIASGTDRDQAEEQIRAINVNAPPDQMNNPSHVDQVDAAKEAAEHLYRVLKDRVGMDIQVTISGHTCLDDQNWDSISVAVGHGASV